MDRAKWTIGIFIVIALLNIAILYFLYFQLKTDFADRLKQEANIIKPTVTVSDLQITPVETISKTCPQNCLDQISNLKKEIAKITPGVIKEVEKVETQTVVSDSSSVKEFYITFGSGSTESDSWEDIPGLSAYINSDNYKNIQSVVFEASLRIPTANGKVYARLYNKTDKRPVWFSEVSFEGDTSTLKRAENITLNQGNKLYQVQMKTSMKYKSLIDSARVKIVVK